jgi:hypothetical protein
MGALLSLNCGHSASKGYPSIDVLREAIGALKNLSTVNRHDIASRSPIAIFCLCISVL